MKRLRDDAHINSQFKRRRRLASSRGESGGEVVVGGENLGDSVGKQTLTKSDALTYIKEVKRMFKDQRGKYNLFLDVMKDFRAQRIDTTGVVARVKELFKGHNNLIFGLNTFLPKGCEITVIDEEEAPPKRIVESDDAINFVNKIKRRFQNDDQVYKSFLDIMKMYRKKYKGMNGKSISKVYHKVAILFVEHQDLLEEFIRFLPDNYVPSGQHSFQPHDHSFAMNATRQEPIDKKRRRDKTNTLLADHGQSHEHDDNDEDNTMIKMQKNLKKHAEKDNKERRAHDQDYREPENESTMEFNMQRLCEKKTSNRRIEGFGMNPPVTSCDDKKSIRSLYKEEFIFCEKVKEMLGSSNDYQAFLKCLQIYSKEIITRKKLQSLVADLLGKYPDLMDGFNKFLKHCQNIDGFLAGLMNKKSLWNDGGGCKPGKKEEQKHEMEQKDKCKEKYMGKSIQELDLSDCQSCSPSYRLLPDDYPIPIPSKRPELGAKVLNDLWVSVTPGSEDYSFKHMRMNPYEESLFRCEDDRFELDMLLESLSSTAKRAEELLNSLNNNTVAPDSPIRIEDHFTVLNLRCIERLYGNQGLNVMEILKKNSCVALPVILTRLKQKQEEWKQCRTDFNKIWGEIYMKNHCKSLDHRSFYFKEHDSKNLSIKSLVTEIKEIKEKIHKVDDTAFSLLARSRYLISPHLEYEYVDAGIHEDLYKLVKYSSEEVCSTKKQLNKVMKLWTSFLEPMLGFSSQSHGIVGTEDDIKERQRRMKSCKEIIGDSNCIPAEDMSTSTSKQAKSVSIESQRKLSISANPCRTSPENGDALSKQDGHVEKEQKITAISDKVSGVDVIAGSSASIAVVGVNSEPTMIPTELASVKPLAKHGISMLPMNEKKDSRVFYGNDTFYVLFRLHQILYERLLSAKLNSKAAETKWKTVKDDSPPDLYGRFMTALYNLLDGSIDNVKFEDDCRAIIGNQSYVLLTLDKLIHKLVKQLQTAATDEKDINLLQLYEYKKSRMQSHSIDSVYYDNVRVILDNENLYRLASSSAGSCLSIQLMDDGRTDKG